MRHSWSKRSHFPLYQWSCRLLSVHPCSFPSDRDRLPSCSSYWRLVIGLIASSLHLCEPTTLATRISGLASPYHLNFDLDPYGHTVEPSRTSSIRRRIRWLRKVFQLWRKEKLLLDTFPDMQEHRPWGHPHWSCHFSWTNQSTWWPILWKGGLWVSQSTSLQFRSPDFGGPPLQGNASHYQEHPNKPIYRPLHITCVQRAWLVWWIGKYPSRWLCHFY